MNATVEDLRPTIVPKSDQLNAEQLLGGPMTITVTDVCLGSGEDQPVVVHYHGEDGRPYKPCKTMRKVLIHAWGPDGRAWAGRLMTLYNDPAVRFGGEDVGGIRISHVSDIDRDIKVSLTSTRGKKAKYEIRRLESASAAGLASIASAQTLDEAKGAFAKAWRAAGKDETRRTALKAAYDKRVAALTPTIPARTYAQIAEAIKSATSAEAAALELVAARDELAPEQVEELGALYRVRWASA